MAEPSNRPAAYADDPRLARVTNVIQWGIDTSFHEDASPENLAAQILKVLDSDAERAAPSPSVELTHEAGGRLTMHLPMPMDLVGNTLVVLGRGGWVIPAAAGAKTMTIVADLEAHDAD